jgi:hypothetical protein
LALSQKKNSENYNTRFFKIKRDQREEIKRRDQEKRSKKRDQRKEIKEKRSKRKKWRKIKDRMKELILHHIPLICCFC